MHPLRFTVWTCLIMLAAGPAGAADPTLVLHLKLDEISGTLAADASGSGNDGAVTTGASGPAWTVGRVGRALEFDDLAGAGARWLAVPWDPSLAITNGLTAMAWIRLRNVDRGEQGIIGRSASTDWRLHMRRRDRRITFVVDTGSRRTLNADLPGAGVVVGTWYHLAATYDGNRMRIYVNGSEVATRTCSGNVQVSPDASLPLGVGAFPSQVGRWEDDFPGALDEVKIWKRALTQAEIQSEMSGGAGFRRLRWQERF